MNGWMIILFNLSLAASMVVPVVFAARLLLRRMPKMYSYVLWIAVFFRAVCPVSFSSPVSLFQAFSAVWTTNGSQLDAVVEDYRATRLAWILGQTEERVGEIKGVFDAAGLTGVNTGITEGMETGVGFSIVQLLGVIWFVGFSVLLLYGVVSGLRLCKKVSMAVKTEDGCYESDRIPTAFVFGFRKPRIYLPVGLSQRERELVMAHERIHLRRRDHWMKMAAWLITVVHWFNPLLWIAFLLMVRDMEMSCDETVLRNLGVEEKKEYSSFLLALAAPSGFPMGSPLTFGESSVKARIKNILRYRKGSTAMGIMAVVLVAVVLIVCLSNPVGEKRVEIIGSGEEQSIGIIGGADGPTSVFVAGVIGNENSKAEKAALGEYYEKVVFLTAWANAVAERNADAVYEMLSPKLQERAEEFGIETAENGQRVMGWSSPFVPDGTTPIVVLGEGETIQGEITYPAITSDPSWWIWKDYLTIEAESDSFRVTDWVQKEYFEINSLEEYLEAYRSYTPNYLHADGLEKSFAEYLQKHYEEGSNPDYYGSYLSPSWAAENTLHLSGGTATVTSEREGTATVLYKWEDGAAEIEMVQPVKQGSGGIWVPKGWSAAVEE